MSVSPTVLLITLVLGVPLMLLALGVLYHAYIFGRQPLDLLEGHVDSLATESAEELLMALQEAVDDMQAQLASQRDTLAGMLSGPRPTFAMALAGSTSGVTDRPMAAGEFVSHLVDDVSTIEAPRDLRTQIVELVEDGLSDRAIARELHIGLEEVRIVRMRGRQ